MQNLPYLRACIKESMRMMPVVSGNLRATGEDTVIEGFRVPKDVSNPRTSYSMKCSCDLLLSGQCVHG